MTRSSALPGPYLPPTWRRPDAHADELAAHGSSPVPTSALPVPYATCDGHRPATVPGPRRTGGESCPDLRR